MPRLFIAIDLPPEAKEQLIAFQQDDIPLARWVKPHQMHLTLRFLGEVDHRQMREIQIALKGISIPPFSISLAGLGQFPVNDRPRVLWVGVENRAPLRELYQKVETQLQQIGFPPEDRRFFPHITLARFKKLPRRGDIEKYIHKYAHFYVEDIPMDEFILFSSKLTSSGAIYQREQVYPLGTRT